MKSLILWRMRERGGRVCGDEQVAGTSSWIREQQYVFKDGNQEWEYRMEKYSKISELTQRREDNKN